MDDPCAARAHVVHHLVRDRLGRSLALDGYDRFEIAVGQELLQLIDDRFVFPMADE
jgi:hypothetical protein